MAKIDKDDIYLQNTSVSLDDYLPGTRASDKKTMSFKVRAIVDAVLVEIGLPQTGTKLVSFIIGESLAIQSDFLIGATSIKSIITNSNVTTAPLTDSFPYFEFDSETGTITGFPVVEAQELIIIYFTLPQDEED